MAPGLSKQGGTSHLKYWLLGFIIWVSVRLHNRNRSCFEGAWNLRDKEIIDLNGGSFRQYIGVYKGSEG